MAPNLRRYRPFREARSFVRNLKLKSSTEWRAFVKCQLPQLGRLPADIPAAPDRIYADKGWTTWGEWLGTGRVADQFKVYRPFREARTFARKLRLKTQREWIALAKGQMPSIGQLPQDIPKAPSWVYAGKGWRGIGDWLGTGRTRRTRRKNK